MVFRVSDSHLEAMDAIAFPFSPELGVDYSSEGSFAKSSNPKFLRKVVRTVEDKFLRFSVEVSSAIISVGVLIELVKTLLVTVALRMVLPRLVT